MRPLFLVFITPLLLFACTGEKEKTAEPVNAEKSIFEEVKEQTVKNPKDADAWYYLADLYERSQMYREEVDALQHVIAIKPEKGYAYMKLGTAYNRLGEYHNAIKQFTTAKKYLPKDPLIYNNLAVAYGKVGKTDDEIRELEKAISIRPHYATARYNLGIAFLKKGKRELALQQYDKLKKFDEAIANALKKEIDAKRT
ncbi:MAG TPA: tetratricopeptide repeat protein [Nitrospirota bacterium]|nr:tetratricopeptide repeat protein [Nitrospirota bacterium]